MWNTIGSRTTLYVPPDEDLLSSGAAAVPSADVCTDDGGGGGFDVVAASRRTTTASHCDGERGANGLASVATTTTTTALLRQPPPSHFIMPRPPVKQPRSLPTERRSVRPASSAIMYQHRPKSRTTDSSSGIASAGGAARLESRLRGDGGGSSDEDLTMMGTGSIRARSDIDLRQRLHEEAAFYRKRLDTYRQAQQNQAALVSRLQAKVLQYKQKCAALEAQMDEQRVKPPPILTTATTSLHSTAAAPSSALEQAQQHLREMREERITDLDVALHRLDDERKRCDALSNHNKILRDQLEESHNTNEELTSDLQKLTNQFEELREEMLIKEDEWKDEEQAFNDYYSTEHNRLLTLWRDVVSIKRLFMEVQGSTERDLGTIRLDIENVGRDVAYVCGRVGRDKQPLIVEPTTVEQIELRAQLETVRGQCEATKIELQAKDDRIQQMAREMQTLEDRCAEAEVNIGQVVKLQDEIELLQGALRDIAHALIHDAETKDVTDLTGATSATHLHLSTPTPIPQKSPKRSRGVTSASAFAESTISAVHAALHRYQSVIHELQVKLQTSREQLLLVRKQCENADANVVHLEQHVHDVVQQLDAAKMQSAQLTQERDLLQKNLSALKGDKHALERQRGETNSLLESVNGEYDKLHKINMKLMKELDALGDEKLFMQTEIDKLTQDASLREMTLRAEEDRGSRTREELLTVKEELNKLYLSHDLLEQQKLEADTLISHLEKLKCDYELQLDKAHGERSNVHESLLKKENMAVTLEMDKKRLQDEVRKLEEEKHALQLQCNDHQNDIQSLRKELLQAEQGKLDLESDKVTLGEKIKFLDIEKGKLDMELGQMVRERTDLSNQLTVMTRKKDALNEELIRVKQKLDQANENNARINRNLEALVTESEEKQCMLDAMDKEIQRLQEQYAALRTEKESLEAVLFDTQTNLETSEVRKAQLEAELHEALVKQENHKGQIARLSKDLERSEKRCAETKSSLTQQAGKQEAEFQHAIAGLRKQNEENVRKLSEERDAIRIGLEKRMAQSLHQLEGEKDGEIHALVERIESLQTHIENVCQQHEELMLRAENDKQQALLIAHHDQQALQDRLDVTCRELDAEKEQLERCKREAHSKFEQERTTINQLKDELNKYKTRLEDNKNKYEEDRFKLEQRIDDTSRERETVQSELERLKVQLHLQEDKYDSVNNQLHDTIRKLKESENSAEMLRKDVTDARRQLTDSNFEKEKYNVTNKELREVIKKVESEKRDQLRQLEDAYQKISGLEDARQGWDKERAHLQHQMRDAEKEQMTIEHNLASLREELQRAQTSNTQQQAEEKELQARLMNESEERERSHQEAHTFKKQIAELDRNLDHTRKELGHARSHSAHLQEQWHAREQDLLVHLEDARTREKRLEDQKHNLEVCLVDATQQIQELKTKCGASESRIKSLDGQLAHLENIKRDIEAKLCSVIATLRRIAGIQLDGTVTHSTQRLLSPSRRWSPARGGGADYDVKLDVTVDVDPELVRKGVRNLMQQVAQIERERDDYKTQIVSCKKQLQESHDTQSKGDTKLTKLMHNLRVLQDEKSNVEAKLAQKAIAYNAQRDELQKCTVEVQQLREKNTALELSVSNCREERSQRDDKLEKYKGALHKVEMEKRALQEELGRCEGRSAKLELQRMSAEGDLQRLQMILAEKDAHIQKLHEKCEHQARNLASLEERCVSLKSTIDQLNLTLERNASNEGEMKVEIQSLQRSLMEASTSYQSSNEKMKSLQKVLASSENDKQICNERLDVTQQNLAELRRNNQLLQDQITHLNQEIANNEVVKAGLESQLRLAQWPSDSSSSHHHHQRDDDLMRQLQNVQRERSELRGKVDSLTSKVRVLESELTHKPRAVEKCELDASISDQSSIKYEQENRELRIKIARLESELAEKESELMRLRMQRTDRSEIERYRAAQQQAERLLDAREQSHRQQIARLESQIASLREQLTQETKRRQQYIMRSSRAGREMQQLRQALGDSLRTVSQDPSLDALLLEQEARKLDNTVLSSTASLPPALSSSYDRSLTPQPPNY